MSDIPSSVTVGGAVIGFVIGFIGGIKAASIFILIWTIVCLTIW